MTTRSATKAQLQETLYASEQTIELLQERFADLELAVEDRGWMRLSTESQREFTREGLRKILLLSVMSFLKNPLIHHAIQVQAHYVWGQGVTIHCPDPATNDVIQKFLSDRRNKKVLTGPQARIEKEEELQTKANLFFVLFTDPKDGRVQIRSFPMEECQDIIRNPNDSAEPWYYVRQYTRLEFDTDSGEIREKKGVREFYPDWLYEPLVRPTKFGEAQVMWDTPVYHLSVNRFSEMRFGIPEYYSALDWATAVKNDLEDYATIRRALARFAFKLTTVQGPKAVSSAKKRMGTTLGIGSGQAADINPPATAGSTWIQPQGGANLEPFKTAGMTPNPEEGRRLWLMVSSGTGIPETILTGDSSVGNYATSRTLDRPTELKMKTRQELWGDVYRDILTYVVRKAKGSITSELSSVPAVVEAAIREATAIVQSGAAIVSLGATPGSDADVELETTDLQINVDFPSILEHDMLPRVQAIVQAATLNGQQTAGTMSDRTLIRLLLKALNVDQADELLDEILPEGAEYFDTEGDAASAAGAVVDAASGGKPKSNVRPPVTPPSSMKEAVVPPPPIMPGPPMMPPTPPPVNPNTDDNGIGMDKTGLHKVAPPPPSMRNKGATPSPSPFDPNAQPNEPGPTGGFQSDTNSQRMKGSTPARGKK